MFSNKADWQGNMDCNLLGSSVHGILQAGILEWVAISSSRGSPQPRDGNLISYVSCIGGKFFTTSVTWEAPSYSLRCTNCHINQMFWVDQLVFHQKLLQSKDIQSIMPRVLYILIMLPSCSILVETMDFMLWDENKWEIWNSLIILPGEPVWSWEITSGNQEACAGSCFATNTDVNLEKSHFSPLGFNFLIFYICGLLYNLWLIHCIEIKMWGLPLWLSGKMSVCQCKGPWLNPWSRKIPHVAQQLSPGATTTEPMLCSRRSHRDKMLVHHIYRVVPTCHN